MKKRLFAIPSLFAAGFLPAEAVALPMKPLFDDGGKIKSLFDVFKLDHQFTLAGHRSHSSHRSHRSSTGGYYYNLPVSPSDNPPASPPTYQAPAAAPAPVPVPLKLLPGNSSKFKEIVREVQFAMLAFGYYNGEIDGVMTPEMRAGLQRMQADYNLKITGTITPETLDALRIVAR